MQTRPSPRLKLEVTSKHPIAYADKPVLLGGKIESIDSTELSERLRLSFNNNIYINNDIGEAEIKSFKTRFEKKMPPSRAVITDFSKLLEDPFKHLVICNMGKFGHGICASHDISAHTMLGFYSGTLNVKNLAQQNFHEEELDFVNEGYRYFQEQGRGMASFFQHLPDPLAYKTSREYQKFLLSVGDNCSIELIKLNTELYSTVFLNKKSKDALATSNIFQMFFFYNNIPIIAFASDCEIRKGEMIGFNYGYNYWHTRKVLPEFFNKDGKVISHFDYYKTFGFLQVPGFNKAVDYQPIIDKTSTNPNEILEKALLNARAIIKLEYLIPVNDLPEKVIIRHNDKEQVFQLTNLEQQLFFYQLKSMLGNTIRKLAFKPHYEISGEWLIQVYQNNPANIAILLDKLGGLVGKFSESSVTHASKPSLKA